MRVFIGADIVPTESNIELFNKGDVNQLIGEELGYLLKLSDFTIMNLEVPLVDTPHPISKWGPNLIAPTSTIKGFKEINSYFFTLANNHILDQGVDGLQSTVELLAQNNIAHAGTGKNLSEAAKPYITEIDGVKLGIYCCAEHEFSIATDSASGANPFDPLESLDHIAELRKKTDYLIVLYHGGKELYRYPSPYLQKVCRKIVDKGADLVVCQHSHCVGCKEDWKDGTIVYGQGNFLFDFDDDIHWETGLLIEVELEKSNDLTVATKAEVIFHALKKAGNGVRMAKAYDADEILKNFNKRSEHIKKPGFVEKKYLEFAKSYLSNYLFQASASQHDYLLRGFNKLLGGNYYPKYFGKRYCSDDLLAIENILICEAHRELFTAGIEDQVKK